MMYGLATMLLSAPASAGTAQITDPDLGTMLGCNFQTDIAVPFDHDLFAETPNGQSFRMVEWSTVKFPAQINPRATPDSLRVAGEINIPVQAVGSGLMLATAGYGGLDSKGVAAEGEIRYIDGRKQSFRLLVGEHAWPAWAGATGRMATPLDLGVNASGDRVTAASRWLPLSYPEIKVESLSLRSRDGLDLYVVGLAMHGCGGALPAAAADETAPAGFSFPIPLNFDLGPFRPAGIDSGRALVDRKLHIEGAELRRSDDSAARFFGVNLVGAGALPAAERAALVADGIVARGYDMVRMHHIDTEQALLNPKRGTGAEPTLRPDMLDRMDKLHAELSARGVYQFVEMWTLRAFRVGEGVQHPENVPGSHKYVAYLWPEWRRAQQEWFRAVYGRKNPYTGKKYADDPAVAIVEITNEDSLLVGWSGGAIEKLPAPHRRRLDELWTGFLRKRYPDEAALSAAWTGGQRPGLQAGESLAIGSVAREPNSRARTELFPTRRAADLVDFYATLEADYFQEMATFVKRDLGFTAPTVCTTSFAVPQADRQLSACDVVDIHPYWDPIAETTAFADQSILQPSGRYFERISSCQADKPCTISEVQHSWPNRFSHEAPLIWATLGARQGWSALLWFAWSHADIRDAPDGPNGALDLEGRFSSDAQMPAASAVFRAVRAANRTWTRWWSEDGLARDLAETQPIYPPETVGLSSYLSRQVRASFADSPPIVEPGTVEGQLWRDQVEPPSRWSPGRLVVSTGDLHAIVGDSRATEAAPDPAVLRATFSVPVSVSLVPSVEPGAWLLTVAGRTDRVGSLWSHGVPGMLVLGDGPALLERLKGTVDVHFTKRPTVVALEPTGAARAEVNVRPLGKGWWRMDADQQTPWFGIRESW